MVGRPGRDRVRPAAALLHLSQRLFPALLEADPEPGPDQPHVGAGEPAEQDVADLVVDRVRPVDPGLLNEHAPQTHAGRDGRDLPGVVGLDATDRDERVTALGQRVGDQILQLAGLVPAEGDAGVAVLPLGPDCAPPRCRVSRSRRCTGDGPNSSWCRVNDSIVILSSPVRGPRRSSMPGTTPSRRPPPPATCEPSGRATRTVVAGGVGVPGRDAARPGTTDPPSTNPTRTCGRSTNCAASTAAEPSRDREAPGRRNGVAGRLRASPR